MGGGLAYSLQAVRRLCHVPLQLQFPLVVLYKYYAFTSLLQVEHWADWRPQLVVTKQTAATASGWLVGCLIDWLMC